MKTATMPSFSWGKPSALPAPSVGVEASGWIRGRWTNAITKARARNMPP